MAEQPDEVLRVFTGAQDSFGRHVLAAAAGGRWSAPTPCTDWNVCDLVNHLTAEQLWVPAMLAGRTVAEIGDRFDGDVLGDDPAAAWTAAAAAARAAFEEPGALERTVRLSYGPRPAAEYCREMAVDALVHGWDLAVGVGGERTIDPDAVAFALAAVSPHADALASSGMFGPPVAVPADAGPQARLLGLLGRDPADPLGAAAG